MYLFCCFLTLTCCLVFHFRYKDALVSLVSHVLQKLQFKYSQTQLEELDDETLDSDVSRSLLINDMKKMPCFFNKMPQIILVPFCVPDTTFV